MILYKFFIILMNVNNLTIVKETDSANLMKITVKNSNIELRMCKFATSIFERKNDIKIIRK